MYFKEWNSGSKYIWRSLSYIFCISSNNYRHWLYSYVGKVICFKILKRRIFRHFIFYIDLHSQNMADSSWWRYWSCSCLSSVLSSKFSLAVIVVFKYSSSIPNILLTSPCECKILEYETNQPNILLGHVNWKPFSQLEVILSSALVFFKYSFRTSGRLQHLDISATYDLWFYLPVCF